MPTTLITASTGTGKTYVNCERITARLVGGLAPPFLLGEPLELWVHQVLVRRMTQIGR